MTDVIIHNDNFTDENGHLHYFNTGRDNVSGLTFPTHYVKNENKHNYTRILQLKLSRDTSLTYSIHECFLLTTVKRNSVCGITNIINIDAIVKSGTVKRENINVTCISLHNNLETSNSYIHNITAATKTELDLNGNIINTLGIWLGTEDVTDIIIKDLSSLAFNSIPNNNYLQFLPCYYESYYLDNENVSNVNMVDFEESIGINIATGVDINNVLLSKVDKMNKTSVVEPKNYKFLSVLYDDLYTITDTNTDEIVNPSSFKYTQVDNSFAKINNNYVQVNEDGNYLIALKVNMDIHDGDNTKMMMSVFLNDDRIDETTSSLYLDPNNKVYHLGFLAGQVQIQLKASDKLYLKARWTNKANIENHCTLQITKLS